MMNEIFISYRRGDAAGHSGRLFDRLNQQFDAQNIFYDQNDPSIEIGKDYFKEIELALDSAKVLLVVIGPDWLSKENQLRLQNEKDLVRHEIVYSLQRCNNSQLKIIPVIVGGAPQLDKLMLPEALHPLVNIQSHEIPNNNTTYDLKLNLLLDHLNRHCEGWISKHSQSMLTGLKSKAESKAKFGQDISVIDVDNNYIQRQLANVALDDWWSSWQVNHKPFVLLGEEGDGKSWTLAQWIVQKLNLYKSQIPIIFMPANIVESDNIIEGMSKSANNITPSILNQQWKERLNFLLDEDTNSSPRILLIVDGLNERPSFDWRSFIDRFFAEPIYKKISLLISCRNTYWKDNLEQEYHNRITQFKLTSFSNEELNQALQSHNLQASDFSGQVLKLVAKPRYFNMVIKLKERLSKIDNGITIDRLIYEDWLDRTERKRNPSIRITHEDFHNLLIELVNRNNSRITREELTNTLKSYNDHESFKQELIAEGILIKQKRGNFEISSQSMVLGLGLLLAYEVEDSGLTNRADIEELIAERLGSSSDSDRIVQICAMALYYSLITDGYPESGRLELFKAWVGSRNLTQADLERFSAYFPIKPSVYFKLAEELWSSEFNNTEIQDYFMVAFLNKNNFKHVSTEMALTFERWFGYIHPLGYAGTFEKDEKKHSDLQKKLEQRLEQPAKLGAIKILNYDCEIIGDINLLRLGQIAMSVISHNNTSLFSKSLITGLICRTIMGYSNVNFGWLLRTCDNEVKCSLFDEANALMKLKKPVAFRTSYSILTSLCNEQSLALRNEIPNEYHYQNSFIQSEPYNSCSPTWPKDKLKEYIKLTKLSSFNIARALQHVALDPSISLNTQEIQRLEGMIDNINFTQINSSRGRTIEDINLKEMESVTCAFKPELYLNVAKKLTVNLLKRSQDCLRFNAYSVFEYLPVLDSSDREIITNCWNASLLNIDDESNNTETILFCLVIHDSPPLEQLKLVLQRGDRTNFLTNNHPQFSPITQQNLPIIVDELNSSNVSFESPPACLLWYLSISLTVLNESMRKIVRQWCDNKEPFIRASAFKIIHNTNDKITAEGVIDNGWATLNTKESWYEDQWGSQLLCQYAKSLPFGEIVKRILPSFFGYAYQCRGYSETELRCYSELIHSIWCSINSITVDKIELLRHVIIEQDLEHCDNITHWTVDTDTNKTIKFINNSWGGGGSKNNQDSPLLDQNGDIELWNTVIQQVTELFVSVNQSGNNWINTSFQNSSLIKVIQRNPQYYKAWVDPVLNGSPQSFQIVRQCQGFYEQLCEALLDHEPAIGAELFFKLSQSNHTKIIDSNTNLRTINFAPFKAIASDRVDALRREIFNNCINDNDLYELALISQVCKKTTWLEELIAELLKSDIDYDIARGLQLSGFLSNDKEENLQNWINTHNNSWLMDVAKNALNHYNNNVWAKEWFNKFMMEDDRLKAWTSFRLFLKCVDRRYWIWKTEVTDIATPLDWKVNILIGYQGSIKEACKKNEKKLKDKFITHNVNERQTWPWMSAYQSD